MNKNFKIIQINGFSGILILGFILSGLFCGFIVFPIWAVMQLWNYFIGQMIEGPIINYYQSTLLWLAIILLIYIYFRKNVSIQIQKEEKANTDNIKEILPNINKDEKPEEDNQNINESKENK